MVLDTSAVVAVIFGEPEAATLIDKLLAADRCLIGTPTIFETTLILTRIYGQESSREAQRFLDEFGVVEIPFSRLHADAAQEAFIRFGKGRHKACLNLGDCQSYAVAKVAEAPLLFIGQDFSQTDITPA